MGWRLTEEVLEHCPDVTYREFRILLALALDARDSTRRGMPGHALLASRGRCSERSVRRVLLALEARCLIKKVRHPAPGVRAVYEILPLGTPATMMAGEHRPSNEQHRPSEAATPATQHGRHLVTSPSQISSQAGAARARSRASANGGPESLIEITIREIQKATGKTIGADWAAKIAAGILDGRSPDTSAAYLIAAIRAERDPRTRFLRHEHPGYD